MKTKINLRAAWLYVKGVFEGEKTPRRKVKPNYWLITGAAIMTAMLLLIVVVS